MTIIEYLKENQTNPLINANYLNSGDLTKNPIPSADFQENLKNFLIFSYGSLEIRKNLEKYAVIANEKLVDTIRNACTNMYISNDFRYKTLYGTTTAEYNPIENYSMTEKIETEYQGEESNVLSKSGSEKNNATSNIDKTDVTSFSGTETNQNIMTGSESDTLTKSGTESDTLSKSGSEHTTNNIGDKTSTVNHAVAPYDSETLAKASADETVEGSQSNDTILTFNSRQDSNVKTYADRQDSNVKTFNNRTDTNITSFNNRVNSSDILETGSNTNELSFDNRKDENVRSFTDRKDVTTHTRSGNIGVTTSQEMLESSRELAEFNLLSIVALDVVKRICNRCYNMEEV